MEARGRREVVTPEAVSLQLQTATVGSRFVAAMIDLVVLGLALLLLLFLLSRVPLDGLAALIVLSSSVFFGILAYFVVLEGFWDGQTPGKRAMRLRVVMNDGSPARLSAVVIRNLVRIVDLLPGMYLVGMVTILATRHDQRLGDLAAGTLVVRRPDDARPAPLSSLAVPDWATALDVSGLTSDDHAVMRSFLQRRHDLDPRARTRIATQLADRIRRHVPGAPPEMDAEVMVQGVMARVREHHGGGSA